MNGGFFLIAKTTIVALAATFSSWLTDDVAASLLVTLAAIFVIVPYRIFKKHKREPPVGWKDFLDRNIVEIILGSVIAPNLVNTITKIVG